MTDKQWINLVEISNGKSQENLIPAFIIDCPWLPGWFGISILDYFTSDQLWLKANFKAIETFPEVIFLPGFWSEYGMCTEPSAFGAKCIFWKNEFPFAEKIIHSTDDILKLKMPNPETDGLLPFMLNRLIICLPEIEASGHHIRFSVSRGPLNIASFLMGTTELLTAMIMEPEMIHKLMRIITDFLVSWHKLQWNSIPTIQGIMMLDDIVGFIGENEFLEFGFPYLKEIYDLDAKVKLFHNDADCRASIRHYPALGINLYNPGLDLSINEMVEMTQNKITVLGNLPPRDVLAAGSPDEVAKTTIEMIAKTKYHNRIMPSCGGGMPPKVSTENLLAFINAVKING
ncbi:MAG: uroporphyrinogen decarboxylase family protein [Bacteroidales bacterium]